MWFALILILTLAEPARAAEVGRGLPDLSVDALASCLLRADAMDEIDAKVDTASDRLVAIRGVIEELRLGMATLRDTARIDERIAVQWMAMDVEYQAARTALRGLRKDMRTALEERQVLASGYNTLCVGRTYREEDLQAAEESMQN